MVEQQVQAEMGQVKRFEAIKFPDGKIGIPDYSSMGSHLLIVGNSECINIDTPEVKWMCGKNIKKGLGIKTTYIRGVLFDTRKRRKAFGISKDGKDALIRIEAPIGTDVSKLQDKARYIKITTGTKQISYFVVESEVVGLKTEMRNIIKKTPRSESSQVFSKEEYDRL